MALGNERPEFLALTEKALWTSILRMASGCSVMAELQDFLTRYSMLSKSYQGTLREPDWFRSRELII
jgi:hypothetical protein